MQRSDQPNSYEARRRAFPERHGAGRGERGSAHPRSPSHVQVAGRQTKPGSQPPQLVGQEQEFVAWSHPSRP